MTRRWTESKHMVYKSEHRKDKSLTLAIAQSDGSSAVGNID